jgi:hypothetical protein
LVTDAARVRHAVPSGAVPPGGKGTSLRFPGKPGLPSAAITRYAPVHHAPHTPARPLNMSRSAAAVQRESVVAAPHVALQPSCWMVPLTDAGVSAVSALYTHVGAARSAGHTRGEHVLL